MGDARAPRSAGYSRMNSEPAACAARSNAQFARVLGRYVGQALDVIAIADRRRSAVCRVRAREETRN
eukprot:2537421-Pleurochrysis_carterae.AAC.1